MAPCSAPHSSRPSSRASASPWGPVADPQRGPAALLRGLDVGLETGLGVEARQVGSQATAQRPAGGGERGDLEERVRRAGPVRRPALSSEGALDRRLRLDAGQGRLLPFAVERQDRGHGFGPGPVRLAHRQHRVGAAGLDRGRGAEHPVTELPGLDAGPHGHAVQLRVARGDPVPDGGPRRDGLAGDDVGERDRDGSGVRFDDARVGAPRRTHAEDVGERGPAARPDLAPQHPTYDHPLAHDVWSEQMPAHVTGASAGIHGGDTRLVVFSRVPVCPSRRIW